jgi:hypothetical protein
MNTFASIFVLYIIYGHGTPVAIGFYSDRPKCEFHAGQLEARRPQKDGFEIFCAQRVVE